ncbi:MAG: GntR family transcriptional regulator [Verrucomicrobia bacterium]|nr:GntR family transcriptional regulator [Verrucomicrobiota bacterium]
MTDRTDNRYTGCVRQNTTSKLAQRAYQHLQEQLWTGALTAGAKISETRIAEDLGMSRTPVREAIRQMEKEGVITQVASSGTFVTMPERAEIMEAYEVRMAIELFAVRKATQRMKPAQIIELQKLCDQMREAIRDFRRSKAELMTGKALRRYLNADLAFHLLLLKAGENRRALAIFGDVQLLSTVFGCRSHRRDLHHVSWVWLHHARVARAVRQRNSTLAQRYLERHMQTSMTAALEAYDARRRDKPLPKTNSAPLTEAMSALIAELRHPSQS